MSERIKSIPEGLMQMATSVKSRVDQALQRRKDDEVLRRQAAGVVTQKEITGRMRWERILEGVSKRWHHPAFQALAEEPDEITPESTRGTIQAEAREKLEKENP